MGIAESVQEGWDSFLNWSDEKGLPFRGISDSLEEKGIPALPFFVFLVLLLVGGAIYLSTGQQLLGIGGPRTATIYLTLKDSAGLPIENADVSIVSEGQDSLSLPGKTDADGGVSFKDVKIGSKFIVKGVDNAGRTLTFTSDSFTVSAKDTSFSFSAQERAVDSTVQLTVEVKGPEDPSTVRISVYDASTQFPVEGSPKAGVFQAKFTGLAPNKRYFIVAAADGFNQENRTFDMKDKDDYLPIITLTKREGPTSAKLRVKVVDSDTDKPLKGATVNILDSNTDAKIYQNLQTNDNGEITPKEIAIKSQVRVLAAFPGYVADSQEASMTDDQALTVALKKIPTEELTAIKIIVKDSAGSAVVNPSVRIYDEKYSKKGELTPVDGVALFKDVGTDNYYVSITKPGYLPAYVSSTQKGNSYNAVLQKASGTNSAKLKVQVETQNGDAVPEASVALYYDDGTPLGVPEKITGPDGILNFDELPLVKIYSKASYNGRAGISSALTLSTAGTGEEEGINLETIVVKPAKGRAVVVVKDHFSSKNVENAKVEFSPSDVEFSPVASCVTKNGRCTVQLQEGYYVASITAPKYDLFTSSQFEVRPNTENKFNFDVVSSEIADKTKAIFVGLFNLKGQQVNSLSPSTTYEAKFVITKPIKFSKAEFQMRIGNIGVPLPNEAAEIIGYDASGAVVSKSDNTEGASNQGYVSATETPTATSEASPTLKLADTALSENAYKYVHFDFQPFEGSKEVMVQFRTRAVSEGKVDMQYRDAFATDKEVLRDPVDNNAPSGALFANMRSQSFPISFEGKCENGLCLQSYFEGRSGTAEDNYEAAISETFKINFKLIAPKGTSVELSAPSNDQTISLTEGISGTAKAVLKNTEDRQILSIVAPSDNPEGSFTVQARRLSNNVDLQLDVKNGEQSTSRTLSFRIVGDQPDLKVTYNVVVDKGGGQVLKALKDNKLTFTVTDSLGLPLKNAFVTVGSGADALGGAIMEAQMQEAKDGTISYALDSVNPPAIGSVSFKVIAEGFKMKKGTIPVQASTLFSLDTRALSLSTNIDSVESAPFSINNLLSNEIKVTYSIVSPSGKYTDLDLQTTTGKIKGLEKAENNLQASISDSVVMVSTNPRQLKEKLQGKVRINAKLGSAEQSEEIPFVVNTDVKQDDLNKLWDVAPDSLSYSLLPPATTTDSQTITLTNNGPAPILINQQSSSPNFYVEPLSKNIDVGETAEFKVTARGTSSSSCTFEDDKVRGTVDFYASTNGFISKKSIKTDLSISATENCAIKNGLKISLPVALTAQLPANSKTKFNSDGSLYVELPSKERLVFDPGAQLTNSLNQYITYQSVAVYPAVSSSGTSGSFVVVPPGVGIQMSQKYIQQAALQEPVGYAGFNSQALSPYSRSFYSGTYQVSFPFTTNLDFEQETEFSQQGAQRIASIEDYDIYFPANVPLVRGKSTQERRATLPPNSIISIQLTPFVNSQNSVEVYFPVDATFIIQDRVRIRTDDFTGSKAIQFPSGTTITLPADARSGTDTVATGGSGDLFNEQRKITIPAGSAVRIPAPYAQETLDGRIQLQLPFKIQFKIPKSERVSLVLDQGGMQAKSISTEIYEVTFVPGSTRLGLQLQDGGRMVEAQPLAQITIQPTDFGVVGISRKIPVSMTLNLDSSVGIKQKGGLTQIEFENGNRILLENAEVVQKDFDAHQVTIPERAEVKFSANAPGAGNRMIAVEKSEYGSETFTLYLPIQTILHFPLTNAVIVQPNSVKNEQSGYQVQFPLDKVSFSKSDNFNDVMLQKTEAARGIKFSEVDPTLPGADFEFQFNFGIKAQIPASQYTQPRLEPYGQKPKEIFHSFRMAEGAEIHLVDTDANDEFWFTANRLMTKEYDVPAADFISDPKTFTIIKDSLTIPRILKDSDGMYILHAKFGTESSFTLPSYAAPYNEKEGIADLKECTNVRIAVAEREYSLPAIRRIVFPKDARLLPQSNQNPDQLQKIVVGKEQEIVMELCEKKVKKDKFAAIEDSVSPLVAFEYVDGQKADPTDKEISLEFDNSNADKEIEKLVCVQNWGFSDLKASFQLEGDPLRTDKMLDYKYGGYLGESVSTGMGNALKQVTRPIAWEQGSLMVISPKDPAAQNCHYQSFKLKFGVPDDYLDEDGCIKEDTTTDAQDTFITVFGEYGGKSVAQKLAVKFKLDKTKGTCSGALFKQFRNMMQGFFVNYADTLDNQKFGTKMKLSFKDVGHERYISAVNNLDVPVTFKITGDTALVTCKPPISQLAPGEGVVIPCTSNDKGKGRLKITPYMKLTPEGNEVEIPNFIRFISLEVFKAETEFQKIYSSSPIGDLAKQEPVNPETPATQQKNTLSNSRPEVVFASGTGHFADTAATTASSETQQGTFGSLAGSVMACQTNFCSSGQVQQSFNDFAHEFVLLIDDLASDKNFPSKLTKFCSQTVSEGGYKKSIVLQAANAHSILSTDFAQDAAFKQFDQYRKDSDNGFKINVQDVEIKECGIYILQARLDVCKFTSPPATKSDWLKYSQIEFKAIPGEKCALTVANAPVLLAERDNTEPVVGREMSNFVSWVPWSEKEGQGGVLGALSKMQFFNVGPYKEAANKRDVQNMNTIYKTLYGIERSEKLSVAEPYNDVPICTVNTLKTVGVATGAGAAAIGAAFLSNLGKGLTGVGAPDAMLSSVYAMKGAYGLSTTLALCAATAGQTAIRATGENKAQFCEASNDCLAGGFAGVTEAMFSAIPGAGTAGAFGTVLGQRLIFETMMYVGIGTAIDGTILGYNAIFDDDVPVYTSTPMMFGGLQIAKSFSSRAYLTDYFLRRGIKLKDANTLAGGIMAANTPKGNAALVGKTLGLDAAYAGATAEQKAADNFVDNYLDSKRVGLTDVAKAADKLEPAAYLEQVDELQQAYKSLNPQDYAAISSERDALRKEIGSLLSDKEATTKAHTLISEKVNPTDKEIGKFIEYDEKLKTLKTNIDQKMDRYFVLNEKVTDGSLLGLKNKIKALGPTNAERLAKIDAVLTKEKLLNPGASGMPKLTDSEAEALLGTAKAEETKRLSKLKRFLGGEYKQLEGYRKTRNLFQLLVPMLFHVDVRPVQGALSYKYPSHIAVFNVDAGKLNDKGSMTRICGTTVEDELKCENTVIPEDICDSGSPDKRAMCIYLVEGKQFASEQGYTLLVGINSGIDSEKFLQSLFYSTDAPLGSKDVNVDRITVQAVAKLSDLPRTTTEEQQITEPDKATAAKELYLQLWESCEVNGYCPGGITSDFLKDIKDKVDTQPQLALDQMLAKSKVAK